MSITISHDSDFQNLQIPLRLLIELYQKRILIIREILTILNDFDTYEINENKYLFYIYFAYFRILF